MTPEAARRANEQAQRISGWFLPGAGLLFGLLDEAQRVLGVRGDVFEIGAHHGRSAMVLVQMLRDDETLRICDVFGGHGYGDRAAVERNLGPHFSRTRIFHGLSSDLDDNEVRNCRFVHIDGGHRRDDVYGDLSLASRTVADGAIVVLDDAFQPAWPEVTEAFFDFTAERDSFEPLVVGFNTLVLVTRGWHDRYWPAVEHPWEYLEQQSQEKPWFAEPRAGLLVARYPILRASSAPAAPVYEPHVRKVIHELNEHRFEWLAPSFSPRATPPDPAQLLDVDVHQLAGSGRS